MDALINAALILGLAYLTVDLIKHIINTIAARKSTTYIPGGSVTSAREREVGNDRDFHPGSSRITMGGALTSLEEKKK